MMIIRIVLINNYYIIPNEIKTKKKTKKKIE
jgi:hypothetical protein